MARTYTVSPGDTLQKVSQKVYGTPQYASYLYLANQRNISNPNQLTPLQILNIPGLTAEQGLEHVKREIFNA